MKYKENDIITDGTWTRKILAVCGQVCAVSQPDVHDSHAGWYTEAQLDEYNYRLVSEDDEEAKKAIKTLERLGRLKDGKILSE